MTTSRTTFVLASTAAGLMLAAGCAGGSSTATTTASGAASSMGSSTSTAATPSSSASSSAASTPTVAPVVLKPTANDPETGINGTMDSGVCDWVSPALLGELAGGQPLSTLGVYAKLPPPYPSLTCTTQLSDGTDPKHALALYLTTRTDTKALSLPDLSLAPAENIGSMGVWKHVPGVGKGAVSLAYQTSDKKGYGQILFVLDGKRFWNIWAP